MADRQYIESRRVLKNYMTFRHRSGTGLTKSGVDVFRVINRAKVKTLPISEIAKRAGLSQRSAHRAVKDLVALGYISVSDAREYEVLRGLK